ncbi:hypothetical protein DOY81_004539, partial [Sarcophaga bullata]
IIFFVFTYQQFILKAKQHKCLFLVDSPVEYYCRGIYPQEISIKYRDEWVEIGEPFVIYRSTQSDTQYLILFRYCELHECRFITFISNIYSKCVPFKTLTNEPVLVRLSNATGICHQFNLQFITDMLRICAKQNNFKEVPKNSTESAIMYYLGERTCSAITIATQTDHRILLCSLLALLAFF